MMFNCKTEYDNWKINTAISVNTNLFNYDLPLKQEDSKTLKL